MQVDRLFFSSNVVCNLSHFRSGPFHIGT